MRICFGFFPTLFLLLLFLCSNGQTPAFRFHTLNIQNKLADNYVNCSLLDSKGFLWFGTYEGLNKYDGYHFKLLAHSISDTSSIGGNFITALFEDREHNLWIGTSKDGLSVLNQRTNVVKRYKPGKGTFDLPYDYISCITQDSRGTLWVGTMNGLCRFDSLKKGFITYKHNQSKQSLSSNAVMCITEDKSGDLWIGTSFGINVYNRKTACFKRILHENGELNSPASNYIRCILQDHRGNLWFGTDDAGICQFNPRTGKYQHFKHNNSERNSLGENQVWCMYEDHQQHIWVGTINGGLNRYNPQSNGFDTYYYSKNDPSSIPSNSLTSILEDASGNLWITTHGGGIAFQNTRDNAFECFKAEANNSNSLSHNTVRCFYEDKKGQIWIGTDGGGLNLFDRKTKTFRAFKTENGLSSNMITDICEADAEHIWLATWKGGICLFNTQNYTIQVFTNDPHDKNSISSNNIKGIHQMSDGKVWIATHGDGLNIYDPTIRSFINSNNHPELNLSWPKWGLGIQAGQDATVWASTVDGLFKIKDLKITHYNNYTRSAQSLSGNYIYAAYRDHQQNMLFATNGGLDLFNVTKGTFSNITDRLGLQGSVKSVIEDCANNLWFTIGNQLIKIRKDNTYELYSDIQQGQFCEKASLRTADGDLYFGNTDGFIIVHPNQIARNSHPPSVYITDFQLFNVSQQAGRSGSVLSTDISETKEIKLKYNQSSFSFEFVAINYLASNQNKYEYQLEGFDKKWHVADESRKAVYTNLGYGTYLFKVKAANNDGVWNKQPATIRIVILPPFWFTFWAYCIYFLIFILALLAYRRLIIFKERLRSEVIKERELDQVKTQFFTNVSHELRTPLTLILGPVESLIQSSLAADEKKQTQLKLIQRNAQRLLRLVNQLLDLSKTDAGKTQLKAQQGDIVAFIRYIAEPFIAQAEDRNIVFDCHFHENSLMLWFDADKTEKILSNVISNALKNTDEHGRIDLSTSENGNNCLIEIKDTGIGIAENDLSHIFDRFYQSNSPLNSKGSGIGLALTKEFVDLHKGKISVESKLGMGTSFTIQLPIGDAHLSDAQKQGTPLFLENASIPVDLPVSGLSRAEYNEKLPRILVVDDNQDIRTFIQSNLSSIYNIIEAADGMQGMEMATENMPDLIISDVMMPITDGIEFCRQIKSDRQTCHIPVVLLTAKSADESKIEGYETGADDYLVKPFKLDILKARIKNLLENRRLLRRSYSDNIAAEPEEFTSNAIDHELIKRIYAIVEERIADTDFNPDILARELLMSRSSLYMKIKAITGESVSIFVRNIRLKKAAEMLKQQKHSVTEIAYNVGFNQTQYFSKCFKEVFGMTPSEYRGQ